MKTCSKCKEGKSLADFHRNKNNKDGRASRCKPCASQATRDWYVDNRERSLAATKKRSKENPDAWRDSYYRKQFGIPYSRYQEMLAEQDGKCAVCRRSGSEFTRKLAVDHDHSCCAGSKSCGQCVRKLLCMHCNTAIGHMNDDVDRMQSAIDYIRSHR